MAKVVDKAVVEKYVQLVASGRSHAEAFKLTHPKNSQKPQTLKNTAYDFHNLPEVQARLAEVMKETGDKWSGFRDELIGYLTEEIRNCYRANETLSPVMKQVEQVSKILGYDKHTVEVKSAVGAMDTESVTEKVNFLIVAAGEAK